MNEQFPTPDNADRPEVYSEPYMVPELPARTADELSAYDISEPPEVDPPEPVNDTADITDLIIPIEPIYRGDALQVVVHELAPPQHEVIPTHESVRDMLPPQVVFDSSMKTLLPDKDYTPENVRHTQEAVASFYAQRRAQRYVGEIPMSRDERQLLSTIHTGIQTIGEELGVDMKGRLPDADFYHLFRNPQQYARVNQALNKNVQESSAAHHPLTGILIPLDSSLPSVFAHETVHAVSRRHLTVNPNGANTEVNPRDVYHLVSESQLGVSAGTGLGELATELMGLRSSVVSGSDPEVIGYPDLMLFGEILLRHAAHEYGEPPSQLHDEFVKGILDGDLTAIAKIQTVIGREAMASVFALLPTENEASLKELATRCGITNVDDEWLQSQHTLSEWPFRTK